VAAALPALYLGCVEVEIVKPKRNQVFTGPPGGTVTVPYEVRVRNNYPNHPIDVSLIKGFFCDSGDFDWVECPQGLTVIRGEVDYPVIQADPNAGFGARHNTLLSAGCSIVRFKVEPSP
jgi:hypothetical protein